MFGDPWWSCIRTHSDLIVATFWGADADVERSHVNIKAPGGGVSNALRREF